MADATPDPLPPASIRRRLVCMVYEAFLLIGVMSVVFVLPHLLLGMARKAAVHGGWMWLHVFLVLLAYFGWLWKRSGQTLAMQTWKIRLESAQGMPLTTGQILLRYVLAWPSLFLGGMGLAWALFDRDRQFLHDRLAGTRLVRVGN